jgi:hypothetical protein
MSSRECYHCKGMVREGEPHDCWTTTEAALTRDLPEDLRDAWERLREAAAELGEQRIYASHHSIMFSRTACYLFVRPKTKYLEVCVFLGRTLHARQVRRTDPASRTKVAHLFRIQHRDEVEAPLTDWLLEAYEWAGLTRAEATVKLAQPGASASAKRSAGRQSARPAGPARGKKR